MSGMFRALIFRDLLILYHGFYLLHIQDCFSIIDAKKNIARQCSITQYSVSIVDMEDGIIYGDDRSLSGLKLPLQVMIGNENRQFPSYLSTEEPDMLTLDDSEDEPRLKMSCGHALCKMIIFIMNFLFAYTELNQRYM